jgi:GntR family transcriptional regulator
MPQSKSPASKMQTAQRHHVSPSPPRVHENEADRIPKYIQLATIIRNKILNQEYKMDHQIPTEEQLGKEYNVSRVTVREAVNRLVQERLVERRQGKGTYVVVQRLRRNIAKLYSFTHDMIHLGLTPSSTVLEQRIVRATAEEVVRLQLTADKKVTRISRVRKANGNPVLLETTSIPYYLSPHLSEADLEHGSLYEELIKNRVFPATAEETYEARVMSPSEAKLLGCAQRRSLAAFAIQRVTFLEDGTPIENTRAIGRGDRLTLAINMVADKADFQRRVGL